MGRTRRTRGSDPALTFIICVMTLIRGLLVGYMQVMVSFIVNNQNDYAGCLHYGHVVCAC